MQVELRDLDRADLDAARRLLAAACPFDDAAAVAEEKLFGASASVPAAALVSVGAFAGEALVGVTVASGNRVRLLAVHPEARRRGVGTVLLAHAESSIAGWCRGHTPLAAAEARTMDQAGNYLAPGIDDRNRETITWLSRRGWRATGDNTNLLVDVRHNPRITAARAAELAARAAADGYTVRRGTDADRPAFPEAVGREFGAAWAFEVDRALGGTPAGLHVALRGDGALAAFSAHDGNNRGLGWFGPAGTWPADRKRGLGEALLLACLLDVAAAGRDVCEVAWIGPRGFYESSVGIAGERRFTVMTKLLDPPTESCS